MKIKSFIFCAVACISMSSCALLGKSTTATASSSGQTSGAALKSLYTQYQTDGKIDMGNMNNVLNIISLTNGIQGLKNVDDRSAFYSDFASGLILGSGNLVTETTSGTITNTLSTLAQTDLSGIISAASDVKSDAQEAAAQAATTASTAVANKAKEAEAKVQGAIETINETTTGVSNVVSSLNSIFGMFE